MGEDLDLHDIALLAMADELEKIAGLADLARRGIQLGGKAVGAVTEGWKRTAPSAMRLQRGFPGASELRRGIAKTYRATHGTAAEGILGRAGQAIRRTFGAGEHLMGKGTKIVGGGIRQGAEQLSRIGVTGQSATTKYLPVGERAQMGVGLLSAAPGIIQSARGTGEAGGPGVAERVGGIAGGLAGGLAGFGRGPLRSIALGVGGGAAGGAVGKRLGSLFSRSKPPQQGEQE